jgi:hypothetical protein
MDFPMPTRPQSERPLSTRERVFIEKYMEFGGGRGAGLPAALAAGFKRSYAPFAAHRMLRRPIVARVIEERQKIRLRVLVPKAVDAIEEILDDKGHKDRLKAANQILNRVDPLLVAHQHAIDVTVKSDDEIGLKLLRWLRELGASREMMESVFGINGLPLLEEQLDGRQESEPDEPVTIESEVLEVEPNDH